MAKRQHIIWMTLATLAVLFAPAAVAQTDTLTLAECHQLAVENFPVLKQKVLYDQAFALKLRNLRANFLPGFAVNGQASYQSDVVALPFSLPNAEPLDLPHERWQVTLDVNQTIFDGGATQANKAIEKDQLQIDQQQVLVDIHQLKTQVNQAYLATLLAGQAAEILQSTLGLLEEKAKTLQAGRQGGVVLESEVLKVEAEILRLRQRIRESRENSKASLNILAILIGKEIEETSTLTMPAEAIDIQTNIVRPELKLFDYQQQKLVTSTKLIQAKTLPRLSAFAQGGYGYPNPFNFFDASISPFYMVGARINWPFWNWNTSRREKELSAVQSEVLETKKENLRRNIQLHLEQQRSDIERLQAVIRDDEAIVKIQERIRKLSSVQLDHGIITSTGYLDEVNAEQQARLNLELHKIQLTQANINYLSEKGTY